MTITEQVAAMVERRLDEAGQAAQIAGEHIDALLSEAVIGNGLRAQLQAIANRLEIHEAIQTALRTAHEAYGSAPRQEEAA